MLAARLGWVERVEGCWTGGAPLSYTLEGQVKTNDVKRRSQNTYNVNKFIKISTMNGALNSKYYNEKTKWDTK